MEDGGQAVLIGTGALPFLILLGAVLTLPVSWLSLALYRRAVLRSMARTSGAAPIAAGMRRSLWALRTVHIVAGLLHALTLSGAWMHFAGAEGGFALARLLWLLSCCAWPTALTIGLLVAVTPAQRLAVGMASLILLLAFAAWALTRKADAILMDLRSFSPQHQGCRYERQQLLDFVPARKRVLLIDTRTNRTFMEATLETLWRQTRTDSPNRRTGALRLQVIEDAGSHTLPALLGALVRAAG
ncbi:hypothetical protein [Thauera sp. WH-1]|uniref:hypothetical protein n=1 Tax=Thauera sp. WH-1 TaxID=3398230 RepID=UPI0039FDD4F9